MPTTLIAELVRPKLQRLEEAILDIVQLPGRLRTDWNRLCREAARTEQVEELHAAREEYREIYDSYLELAEGYFGLAEKDSSPLASDVRQAANEIRQLADEIFSTWQTLDDLYRILIDKLSLPNEVLLQLAKIHKPPQSWYDETSNPFTPE